MQDGLSDGSFVALRAQTVQVEVEARTIARLVEITRSLLPELIRLHSQRGHQNLVSEVIVDLLPRYVGSRQLMALSRGEVSFR